MWHKMKKVKKTDKMDKIEKVKKTDKTTKYTYFLGLFTFFSCINFYFSNLITDKLMHGWYFSSPIIKLIYIENTGAAFSLLQNSTTFLIVISLIILFMGFYIVAKNIENIPFKDFFFLSILSAGILGNLAERLIFGHVRDFIELKFINFPIFNIADIYINIGVIGIIALILFTKKPIKLL